MKKININIGSSTVGGIGFAGVLTLIFIVLRSLHLINWSWWWVFSPILISWGLFLLGFIIFLIWWKKR